MGFVLKKTRVKNQNQSSSSALSIRPSSRVGTIKGETAIFLKAELFVDSVGMFSSFAIARILARLLSFNESQLGTSRISLAFSRRSANGSSVSSLSVSWNIFEDPR